MDSTNLKKLREVRNYQLNNQIRNQYSWDNDFHCETLYWMSLQETFIQALIYCYLSGQLDQTLILSPLSPFLLHCHLFSLVLVLPLLLPILLSWLLLPLSLLLNYSLLTYTTLGCGPEDNSFNASKKEK